MSLVITICCSTILVAICLWILGAIYFDVCRENVATTTLLFGVWLVLVGYLLMSFPIQTATIVISILLTPVLVWWFSQKPQNHRRWDPNFAQTCRIQITDNKIIVENVRNTEYRSLSDYDVSYETREYQLSDLLGADILILFWGSNLLSHPMVIFDFGKSRHLCFSVEVRYQKDQSYNFLKGLYRQYELMYVVSDERDAILRRTKHAENQSCYLYRLQADLENVTTLFHEYAQAANDLADSPRWYHAVTDNCTTTVIKRQTNKLAFDLRLYVNGSLDRLLYERGLLDNQLPFEDLKQQSLINSKANKATAENFASAIREGLPGF